MRESRLEWRSNGVDMMFDQLAIYSGKNVFSHEEVEVKATKRKSPRTGPVSKQILDYLKANPGATAHQINVHIGGSAIRVQHRLRGLGKRQLVTSKVMEAKLGTVANGASLAKHYWRVE